MVWGRKAEIQVDVIKVVITTHHEIYLSLMLRLLNTYPALQMKAVQELDTEILVNIVDE